MGPMNLHFDFRDVFRAPRLALSGKKIWTLLEANIVGYAVYWILTYVSLAVSGIPFSQAWAKYGLYPCLVGNEGNWASYAIWTAGVIFWLAALVLGATAVSRITYKQLKGDEFYSSGDAWRFVKKHWHAPVFTHLSVAIIALFFVVMAVVFGLIGKIPYLGELFFGIPYLLWFFGSVFVVYTAVVLVVSFFFTHAIVATLEEDTMGSVFQNYSITWSQPWRAVVYLVLLGGLIYVGVTVFTWFLSAGYGLINLVFGHTWLMGSKLASMMSWSSDIVLDRLSPGLWYLGFSASPSTIIDIPAGGPLSAVEYVGGFFIAVSLFLVVASVISYALSVQVVGETLAVVIFRKKTDDENLLERKDEEELEAEEEAAPEAPPEVGKPEEEKAKAEAAEESEEPEEESDEEPSSQEED
ncbi:MAG: hypothetical protein ACE5HZ_03900 [Fidelibacterota bacterium]